MTSSVAFPTLDPAPVISLASLSKIFIRGNEEIRALNEVSLEISQGEFVAITGSSGSGKSTLLYILGLLDRQSSGTYLLHGKSTEELKDNDRSSLRNKNFGFIFQSFHLISRADALRNVAMPLEYVGSFGDTLDGEEIHKRSETALKRVGLGDRMYHRPNELSGGQRQRVAIARALVNSPTILFADEPTGNLDSKNASEIFQLFKSLHADNKTIILVTHDPALAQQAHRQLRMHDGKIVEDTKR